MIPFVAVLLVSSVAFASGADTARVPRAKVANAEKLINTQMAAMYPEEPYFLIGFARGTYLDGVGAIFSVEINLATGPTQSPFRPAVTKEEIAKHREKKEVRIPLLKQRMLAITGSMANYLETLPPNEELVLTVTLLRYPYEDPAGMPSQIVMRVNKGRLIEAQRANAKLDSVIRTLEY